MLERTLEITTSNLSSLINKLRASKTTGHANGHSTRKERALTPNQIFSLFWPLHLNSAHMLLFSDLGPTQRKLLVPPLFYSRQLFMFSA